jgi:hypothetical protein
MENIYFVNLDTKQIHVPNSRWYEIGDYTKTKTAYSGVTTVLGVKSKQGLLNWQIQVAKSGVDPKELGQQNMNEGSKVHSAAVWLMNGEKLIFTEEDYDFYGEWLPICRFYEAYKELEIQPLLIEQTVWSNRMKVAGTLDQLSLIKLKDVKNPVLALIDLKRSASAYTDYQWQIAAYKECLVEMIERPDSISKRLVSYLCEKMKVTKDELVDIIKGTRCFLLLLNTPTKKGWRLTEVENLETKLAGFEACNALFKIEYPNLEYVRELYPTELKLN